MAMAVVDAQIVRAEIAALAKSRFGEMVKAVVDVRLGIMAIGAEMHSDEEAQLLDRGSQQADLWGINFYPERSGADWIEFDSMINIRPAQKNRSRGVDDPAVRDQILQVVHRLVR